MTDDRRPAPYLIGIDGGGTRTTLALADGAGREILRRTGAPGLVDPRRPAGVAEALAGLAREAVAEAGLAGPARALCAGLAGVGDPAVRAVVRSALEGEGIAREVLVCTDGETALEGALDGSAGILLIAGTGSIGYGRGEDGRVERCGGWGMIAGDEGSGFWMGRASLAESLRAFDGRGPETRLLPRLLEALGLAAPPDIPSWVGRAEKSAIAALTRHVLELADEGDEVADRIVRQASRDLANHARALFLRLRPWTPPVAVVLHGGVLTHRGYAARVEAALSDLALPLELRPAAADAVAGAVRLARALADGPAGATRNPGPGEDP